MAKVVYSRELCGELLEARKKAALSLSFQPARYEDGDVLSIDFTTVWPEIEGHGQFLIQKFVGGGFAGQVYRCELKELTGDFPELRPGGIYGVKIMIPPTGFSRIFRDILYWLGFQTPFSAQVNRSACRAGLLWQKVSRLAGAKTFGRADAVADAYATFYDATIGAYGEIREWVEGRTWRLEPDLNLRTRRKWRTIDPRETGSPEFIAKRQFMSRFVGMLHDMGAPELARQYEWSTLKSQPNALKRHGFDHDPEAGLCAVDFRAGLVLMPWLPMSPADFPLIFAGLRRGSLVQFDRPDLKKFRAFADTHADVFGAHPGMVDALCTYETAYRRSMPDVTHQGLRLLWDGGLRRDVRHGLCQAYAAKGLIDDDFACRLAEQPMRFTLFQALIVAPFLRKLWGCTAYREHRRRQFREKGYLARSLRGGAATRLVGWHRSGRTSEARTRYLQAHTGLFWLQRFTLGLLPGGLHHVIAEPGCVWAWFRGGIQFILNFYRDPDFREKWLADMVQSGYKDGMLDEGERDEILTRIKDPYIVKYLKSLAVHFATLPVTQIVSVITGGIVVAWMLSTGKSWQSATVTFAAILVAFQLTPISPGSICRGLYVVYLMIKERNYRDYLIAAPISFVKYLGYLAFPFQMVTTYPALSRFMASRTATDMVHAIPVFGEKGALLEHWVFDMSYNVPRVFGRWAGKRVKGLLDGWLLIGLLILVGFFWGTDLDWADKLVIKKAVNLSMAVLVLFVLPRVLFYPVLSRKKARPADSSHDVS